MQILKKMNELMKKSSSKMQFRIILVYIVKYCIIMLYRTIDRIKKAMINNILIN